MSVFDGLVADMDAGLHSSESGFGGVVKFRHTQTHAITRIDMVLIDDEAGSRLYSSNEKSRGIKSTKPIKYHVATSELPSHVDEYEAILCDGNLYNIASIDSVDSHLSELVFIPVKQGETNNGSWLRDDT